MNILAISKRVFFIALLINTSIGNQQFMFGPINFGTFFTWLAILCAIIILVKTLNNHFISILLVSFILVFRILESLSVIFLILYFVSISLLYLYTGFIIFTQNINMIYKQVIFVVFVSIFFQLFQLIGVWEWPYFFTTFGEYDPGEVIFVELNNLNIIRSQLRPSGILASPIYQSLITAFAIVLHFSRKVNKIPFVSIAIILMIILSNSKYPFMSFFAISLLIIILGTKNQRYFIIKSVMIYFIIISIYSKIFPGVYDLTLNPRLFIWSFFVRFNNIIQIMYPEQNAPIFIQLFTYDTPKAYWHESGDYIASGYALMAKFKVLIYIGPIFVIFILKYIKSYRTIIKNNTSNKMIFSLACAIITITYPVMFDIFSNPIYWFITGGTVIPIILSSKKQLSHVSSSFRSY